MDKTGLRGCQQLPDANTADASKEDKISSAYDLVEGVVTALVDYDNVKANREVTRIDAQANVASLVERCLEVANRIFPGLVELRLRLYGGWVDKLGQFTLRAQWILPCLPAHRRHFGRVLVNPTLVTTMAFHPQLRLRGTYDAVLQRQKMVDGMLTVDALHYAGAADTSMMIVTDDDDLVPAAIVACGQQRPVWWARVRPDGRAPNDDLLREVGIELREF